MKKYFGLLLVPILLAGCVDLPGHVARNHTVKGELPPEIDPKLPATPPATNLPKASDAADSNPSAPSGAATKARTTAAARESSSHDQTPVTPEQVTAENARQMADALRRELDQAEAENRKN